MIYFEEILQTDISRLLPQLIKLRIGHHMSIGNVYRPDLLVVFSVYIILRSL
jgi:hypothetical protein